MSSSQQDEFELVQDVYDALAKRADEHGIENLSWPERVVLLTWWAKGIIDNGGFQYFYEGASNPEEVAVAFETLGFTEAAMAFRRSRNVFPFRQLPVDHERRREWMEAHQAEINPFFDTLNPLIWEMESLEIALATYIRSHIDSI